MSERGQWADAAAGLSIDPAASAPPRERGLQDDAVLLAAPAPPLVLKLWAGPFTGLYRGHVVKPGEPLEVSPHEALSGWFKDPSADVIVEG